MKTQLVTFTRMRWRLRRWTLAGIIIVVVLGLLAAVLAALPALSPGIGASVADKLRAVIGPEPVAQLESASFRIQDVFDRLRFRLTGGRPQLTWADTEPVELPPTPAPKIKGPDAQVSTHDTFVDVQPRSISQLGVVDAPPSIAGGWHAFGPLVSGTPVMARVSVQPDRTRAYALAAVVRIDLSQTRLFIVPGTVEPVAAKNVPAFNRPGAVPPEVRMNGALLAAFNGGFKAIHGGYGMKVDSVTILPPQEGIATLAVYRDGSVRMGAWGREITATNDLIAYRQNCPLLLDAGQINPSVNDGSRKEWGYTVKNLDTTWRSGVGISRDGRFLIYAAGNSLTVESLAHALQEGGAYYAMQLDINGYYTRFVTYLPSKAGSRYSVEAVKLLDQMTAGPTQFLSPYDRDFFYVTAVPQASERKVARTGIKELPKN